MSSKRLNEVYIWTQIDGKPVIAGKFNNTDRVGTFFMPILILIEKVPNYRYFF
jgi:hypothetical protein